MAQNKKVAANPQPQTQPVTNAAEKPKRTKLLVSDDIRLTMAGGVIALSITVLLLFLLNKIIYTVYHPDINSILQDAYKVSFKEHESFVPEPVERMQYQLSLLLTPFFALGGYFVASKLRDKLRELPMLAGGVNYGGIALFCLYTAFIFQGEMVNYPGKAMTVFFDNDLVNLMTLIPTIVLSVGMAFVLYLYYRNPEHKKKANIAKFASLAVVLFVVIDLVMYNFFRLAVQDRGSGMETNAVFYSISQIYAGKAFLVDLSAQYGFYAWMLNPVFKVLGLSVENVGMVFALLNGVSFVLMYLALRRLIKTDIWSLMVFLTVVWWMYWQTRFPAGAAPRNYYQYYPIRILFPSLCLYLLSVYFTTDREKLKMPVLVLLALSSSLAVLWNLDTGIVTFGAVMISLLYSAIDTKAVSASIKKAASYVGILFAGLALVFFWFSISVKMTSGQWPHFSQFGAYQSIFYLSGYFLMKMNAVHFWNLPVLLLLIGCIYSVTNFFGERQKDAPVVTFLFILGAGIFSYFQGRSFDLNIEAVIYPSVILLGVFGEKLFDLWLSVKEKARLREAVAILVIVVFFICDASFSFLYAMPAIHNFAKENATSPDEIKEAKLKKSKDFLDANFKKGDTVLVLAEDYEAYYYTMGHFYNPCPLPSTTEMFFNKECDTLLKYIGTTRHPILYDRAHNFYYNRERILKVLVDSTVVQKMSEDRSMVIMRHGRNNVLRRLPRTEKTLYYGHIQDLNFPTYLLKLPENFTIECYLTLDTTKMVRDVTVFSNVSNSAPFGGFIFVQAGEDLADYLFSMGDGMKFSTGVMCRLNKRAENHLVIKVQRNVMTVYNNDQLCGQNDQNGPFANSDKKFYINDFFCGDVTEIRVTAN